MRLASKRHGIALATLVALGLFQGSACAEDTLQVWTRSSADGRKTYDAIAEAFTKKTGIRIEYFNAMTDFEQRLARAAAGNDLPDLIINDVGSLGQFVGMGIADEIDRGKIAGGADLHEAAWRGAKAYNGKYYAVPTSAQAHVLFIRKDWRTKLKMPVPQTWAEVQALAKAFTEKDPDGNGRADTYGFVFPGSTTRGYTAWFMSSFLWQSGGDFIRPAGQDQYKASLTEPGAVLTLNWFKRLLCDDKVMQPNAVNATTQEANQAFISGQAGMYLSGPYHIALFDKEPGRDKVEVVPAPAGNGGKAVLAGGELAYVMKTGTQKAAAQKFIEFLISPEGQSLGMKAPAGGLPVVRLPVNKKVDVGATYQDPRWQMVAEEYAQHGHALPAIPNWAKVQQVAAEGFNASLSRCSTAVHADLQALNAKVDEELARQKVLAK
jgi:multiple sugar transport system substrate-binding protein